MAGVMGRGQEWLGVAEMKGQVWIDSFKGCGSLDLTASAGAQRAHT